MKPKSSKTGIRLSLGRQLLETSAQHVPSNPRIRLPRSLPISTLDTRAILVQTPVVVSTSETTVSFPSNSEHLPETELTQRIAELWQAQTQQATLAKMTNAELKESRLLLGGELSLLKEHLARIGRNGEWASFLRKRKIPRTTADRYIARHSAMQQTALKRTTGALSDGTLESIQALVSRTVRGTKKVISLDQVHLFLKMLREALLIALAAPPAVSEEGIGLE